jgi:meiotically up-regulated gene 157 (Mug157) protein
MPVMAFAPMAALPVQWEFEQGEEIRYKGTHDCLLKSEESAVLDIFWGVGFEEVAAATAAKELLRQGFDAVYEETLCWLRKRQKNVGIAEVDSLLNRNLFFNFFYATGITMDTEETVMVTSRSPRYYVSAAYWDRDSLLWSFPSILKADPQYAKALLDYVFTRQIKQIGIHSRYIDGTVLEPGFELDELCAPLMALSRYINATGEIFVLWESHIEKGVKKILSTLKSKRSQTLHLYETFLQPTDDMRVYPYGTYDNILTWRCLKDLEKLYRNLWPAETLKCLEKEVLSLFDAIKTHCIKEYQGKMIFAWSVDEEGNWDVYDEPPGSLELLPYLGFCDKEDPVWKNTVEIIRSPDYPYSFAGKPFSDIGCPHAPHPWILSVANGLISGRKEASLDFLLRASMDNGIACESVDEVTGECTTGAAFATCAGFLAYCLMEGFDEGGGKRDTV